MVVVVMMVMVMVMMAPCEWVPPYVFTFLILIFVLALVMLLLLSCFLLLTLIFGFSFILGFRGLLSLLLHGLRVVFVGICSDLSRNLCFLFIVILVLCIFPCLSIILCLFLIAILGIFSDLLTLLGIEVIIIVQLWEIVHESVFVEGHLISSNTGSLSLGGNLCSSCQANDKLNLHV